MAERRQYPAKNIGMVAYRALGQAAMEPYPFEICINSWIIVLGVALSVRRFLCEKANELPHSTLEADCDSRS